MECSNEKNLLATLLFSGATFAQNYQSISEAAYVNVEDADLYRIGTLYYFSGRNTLGPLDQFSYINTHNNVFGSFTDDESNNQYHVGGEFFKDQFAVAGQFTRHDYDSDATNVLQASLGYFFSSDFIARVHVIDVEDGDTDFSFSAQYNLDLNTTDYLGFTASTDDELDTISLATKYFKALNNGQYLTAGLNLSVGDVDSWSLDGRYYFTSKTSAFAKLDKYDNVEVGAKHFFNNNIALAASYGNNFDHSYDLYRLTLSAQF